MKDEMLTFLLARNAYNDARDALIFAYNLQSNEKIQEIVELDNVSYGVSVSPTVEKKLKPEVGVQGLNDLMQSLSPQARAAVQWYPKLKKRELSGLSNKEREKILACYDDLASKPRINVKPMVS